MGDLSLLGLVRSTFVDCRDRPCLEIGDTRLTYGEVAQIAGAIAAALGPAPELVGILAARSRSAYSGILGALACGRGFMPLNPTWPARRLIDMIARSGVRDIVVGHEGLELAHQIAAHFHSRLRFVFPEGGDENGLGRLALAHDILRTVDVASNRDLPEYATIGPDQIAYLLFTSGTTGRPKGVPVKHRNIRAYLGAMSATERIMPEDRCSHFFDLTFDPSVHDVFLTWMAGACLCVVPEHARISPAQFIRDKRLTCWHSVPSVIVMLERLRELKPGTFPSLRLSRFAGEALAFEAARSWQTAAPNSLIENLYGPTECAINVTRHRWQLDDPVRNGTVAIGQALKSVQAFLVNDDGATVIGPGRGELVIAGEQVTGRYLDDPGLTEERFGSFPQIAVGRCYRTGDLVERDESGCFVYLGRLDDQVQVQGHRVELAEVDMAICEACGIPIALTIAWPPKATRVESLIAFVPKECSLTTSEIRRRIQNQLPMYMVPSRVLRIDKFPLNVNGKFDRAALARLAVEEGKKDKGSPLPNV